MRTDKQETDTQRELLQSQTNVEESQDNQNYPLIKREKVEGTPFHLVNANEEGWFIALGKYRMTEVGYYTKSELEVMVMNKDWTLILDTIAVLTEGQK